MDLESIFGLPAHPLVVHAAVVLLPLAAIGTLVVAAAPRARRHYAPLALAAALAATVAVGLAQTSGDALEDQVRVTDLVEEHTDQGESVLPWAIAVTVAAGLVVELEPRPPARTCGGRPAGTGRSPRDGLPGARLPRPDPTGQPYRRGDRTRILTAVK